MKAAKTKWIGVGLILLALIPTMWVLATEGFGLVAQVAGGGGTASGGPYVLQALIGQPEVGSLGGQAYRLNGGVLGEVLSIPTPSITPSPTLNLTATAGATQTQIAQTATAAAQTGTATALTATSGAGLTQTAIVQTGTPAALTATAGAGLTQTVIAQTQTATALTATAASWTRTPTFTPTQSGALKTTIHLPLILKNWRSQQETEPNDLFAQANAIIPGSVSGAHDGAAGTGDVFSMELEAGQIVDVQLSTQNPNGVQLIAYGGEAPDEIVRDFTPPFEINFVAVASGRHYLYVFSPANVNNAARYVLAVSVRR